MMSDYTKEELQEALQAITSMVERSEKAQVKFVQGTPQHTLQKNRIQALNITFALITQELGNSSAADVFEKTELEKAVAPITSLINKSEKSQTKLLPNTWQYKMLGGCLKALHIGLSLLKKALNEVP